MRRSRSVSEAGWRRVFEEGRQSSTACRGKLPKAQLIQVRAKTQTRSMCQVHSVSASRNASKEEVGAPEEMGGQGAAGERDRRKECRNCVGGQPRRRHRADVLRGRFLADL